MALIVIDAGHGGGNPGAVYEGRQEKDDTLALALEVGRILEQNGVEVYYTRTGDVYESPAQKAVETLVTNPYGEAGRLAYNINTRLEEVGFENQGVNQRDNLAVLNRTQMPAVLVEAGFINTDADNRLFDERFGDMAQAIADGILATLWGT